MLGSEQAGQEVSWNHIFKFSQRKTPMLTFVNSTNADLWGAIMFYAKRVWRRRLETRRLVPHAPIREHCAYRGSLREINNRYWCYYAEIAGRTPTSPSGPYPEYVPANGSPFDHCYWIGTTSSYDSYDLI